MCTVFISNTNGAVNIDSIDPVLPTKERDIVVACSGEREGVGRVPGNTLDCLPFQPAVMK
jgi:hypothetical protein